MGVRIRNVLAILAVILASVIAGAVGWISMERHQERRASEYVFEVRSGGREAARVASLLNKNWTTAPTDIPMETEPIAVFVVSPWRSEVEFRPVRDDVVAKALGVPADRASIENFLRGVQLRRFDSGADDSSSIGIRLTTDSGYLFLALEGGEERYHGDARRLLGALRELNN